MKYNKAIGVIGIPGDRSNKMAKEIGRISGENLDYIIIKEDADRRGRKAGEIAALIESGLDEKVNRKIVLDEVMAFKEALKISNKDDIVIVFFEQLNPLREVIELSKNKIKEDKSDLVNL